MSEQSSQSSQNQAVRICNELFSEDQSTQLLSPDQQQEKRKIQLEQSRVYDTIQRQTFKKVKPFQVNPTHTLTQCVRQMKDKMTKEDKDEDKEGLINEKNDKHDNRPNKGEESETHGQQTDHEIGDDINSIPNIKTAFVAAPVTDEKKPTKRCTYIPSRSLMTCPYDPELCQMCLEKRYQCHAVQFSDYCTNGVIFECKKSPLTMTKKKCTLVFTAAYNGAFCYNSLRESHRLIPQAYYFPPPCLKNELNDIVDLVERDISKVIEGKDPIISAREVGPAKEVVEPYMFLLDPGSPKDEYCSDKPYEIKVEGKCEDCGRDEEACYEYLYAAYCNAYTIRKYQTYPTAMTKETARLECIKIFQSALHFVYHEDMNVYASRCFYLPPKCLDRHMQSCIAFVSDKQTELVEKDMDAYLEWRETSMDFDGVEVEDW